MERLETKMFLELKPRLPIDHEKEGDSQYISMVFDGICPETGKDNMIDLTIIFCTTRDSIDYMYSIHEINHSHPLVYSSSDAKKVFEEVKKKLTLWYIK